MNSFESAFPWRAYSGDHLYRRPRQGRVRIELEATTEDLTDPIDRISVEVTLRAPDRRKPPRRAGGTRKAR